jgi:hypothetical protein
MAREIVWRCTNCDKWSHAQAKPAHHLRWDVEADPEDHKFVADNRYGFGDTPGAWVECGPFAGWIAEPL